MSDAEAENALRQALTQISTSPEERAAAASLADSLRNASALDRRSRPRSRSAMAAALAGAIAVVAIAVLAVHVGDGGGSAGGSAGSAAGTAASPSVPGAQLDLLLRTVTGSGAQTTSSAHFPHARYTFFAWSDPTSCLDDIELVDAGGGLWGGAVYDSGDMRTSHPSRSLVQTDVPDGDYRLRVTVVAPGCSWMLEEVLNSMSTTEPAPSPQPLSTAPDGVPVVTDATTPIPILATGLYSVRWSLTLRNGALCQSSLALRRSTGELEVLSLPATSGGGSGTTGGENEMFLIAGPRTVAGSSTCAWQVSVSPVIGPLGGGTQGFAPPPAS